MRRRRTRSSSAPCTFIRRSRNICRSSSPNWDRSRRRKEHDHSKDRERNVVRHTHCSAALSLRAKCQINGLKQSRVAEGLQQALYCTLFDYLRANSVFSLSGYEDNRNLWPAKL